MCSEPILVVTHKVGVCKVDPQGKDCYTIFTRLSFNGKTTVVQCESICTVKWGTCNIGRPYLKLSFGMFSPESFIFTPVGIN